MTPELTAELDRVGYGATFRKEYLAPLFEHLSNTDDLFAQKSIDDLIRTDGTGAIEFALSALWAGDYMFNYINQFYQQKPGDKYIDIGCGFGGAVVGAHKKGLKVAGIELDTHRIHAARSLLKDNGVKGEIHEINIFDDEFQKFGKFKLITSLNVVEHVNDVRRFIKTMINALDDGGCLYIEVPNFRSLEIVEREPHYGLPLISLLEYESARSLFNSRPDKDIWQVGYDVGEYYTLEYYEQIAHEMGVKFDYTHNLISYVDPVRAANLFKKIIAHHENIDNEYPNVSPHVRERLKINTLSYIADAARGISDRYSGGLTPRRNLEYFSPSFHMCFRK